MCVCVGEVCVCECVCVCVCGGGVVTGISQTFTHRRHLQSRTLEANADLTTSRSVFIFRKERTKKIYFIFCNIVQRIIITIVQIMTKACNFYQC